jgi:uncharacterized membrane protein (DUF2068 family)
VTPDRESRDVVLRLIALGKLVKGLVLLVGGLAVLRYVHDDVADVLRRWSHHLHLDPDGRLTRDALRHAADLDTRRIHALGGGMLVYAALLVTEGIGLALRRRWAEYFTVVVTGSFVPLELYEIARHPTVTRIVVLAVNLAIVWYLIARLRREAR